MHQNLIILIIIFCSIIFFYHVQLTFVIISLSICLLNSFPEFPLILCYLNVSFSENVALNKIYTFCLSYFYVYVLCCSCLCDCVCVHVHNPPPWSTCLYCLLECFHLMFHVYLNRLAAWQSKQFVLRIQFLSWNCSSSWGILKTQKTRFTCKTFIGTQGCIWFWMEYVMCSELC